MLSTDVVCVGLSWLMPLFVTAAEDTPSKSADASGQPKEDLSQSAKEMSEKDRRRLERLYRLGEKPAILIYPNRAARGGRFECHRVSLHSLLNYQSEEQKELIFEVSLFAEQFNTMLQRDSAFTIFKAIYSAPEKDVKDVKYEATYSAFATRGRNVSIFAKRIGSYYAVDYGAMILPSSLLTLYVVRALSSDFFLFVLQV